MEKKRVPALRFPGFEGEWEVTSIGDMTEVVAGATPSTNIKEYWNGNIKWMNSGELNLKRVYDVANRITELGLKKTSTRLLPPFCVMIGLAGQGRTRGTVAINMVSLCTNQSIGSVLPNDSFYPDFVFQNLDSRYDEIRGLSTGDGGRGGLNLQVIKSIKISLPTKSEQQKIASFLTSVDERIRLLKKKKDALETYKKAVMQQLFSQRLRFKDEEGKDFPEWEEKNGAEVFESISDKTHNSDLPILAISQEFGAIPRELIDYKISVTEKSVESYKVVKQGDFIISLRSFQGGIEFSNYHGICSPAYIVLRQRIAVDRLFYKYYFKTEAYIKKLNSKLEGIRDGKMISYKYFSDIGLPVPSLEEQTLIASFLTSLDDKISAVGQQIEKTQTYKKGLLQQLFV